MKNARAFDVKKRWYLMKKRGVFDEIKRGFSMKTLWFLMKKAVVFDKKNGGF